MAKLQDKQVLKKLVNKNFSLGDFNKYLNNTYNANVYCPFHEHSYQGKGNAKMYYDEEEDIWVLHCFVKCGTLTAYDYVDRILVQREGKYRSVYDFLIQKLGNNEFLEKYKEAESQIDYLNETEYAEKKKYIMNVYDEYDNVTDFIESLYTEMDLTTS